VRLWDASDGRLLGTPLTTNSAIWLVRFTDGGSKLLVHAANTLFSLAVSADDLLALAEERISRELTDEECRVFLHLSDGCPSAAR
jgi:hypothetical protein